MSVFKARPRAPRLLCRTLPKRVPGGVSGGSGRAIRHRPAEAVVPTSAVGNTAFATRSAASVAGTGEWVYGKNMTNESLPADLASALAAALRAQGARVAPIRADGRLASFDVLLANGQSFVIKVEEAIW